jgi:antitoxin component HigA of HigAB toxin-antitoxin module
MKYFQLPVIQSDDDLDVAIDQIDTLIDMEPLDRTEGEFLNELSDIVWEYEEIHYPMLGAFE